MMSQPSNSVKDDWDSLGQSASIEYNGRPPCVRLQQKKTYSASGEM